MNVDLKLLDFLDTKMLETRKNEHLSYCEKIAIYNLIIDVQEFLKKRMEEKENA